MEDRASDRAETLDWSRTEERVLGTPSVSREAVRREDLAHRERGRRGGVDHTNVAVRRGSTYSRTAARASGLSAFPSSTSGTSLGQACCATSTSGSRSRRARTYAPLRTVSTVASTPTARRAVAESAAAAPGRMTPIVGTGNSSRTVSSATDVAVLHAITTSLQSALANQRIASRVKATTSAGSRGPYGMRASSPR